MNIKAGIIVVILLAAIGGIFIRNSRRPSTPTVKAPTLSQSAAPLKSVTPPASSPTPPTASNPASPKPVLKSMPGTVAAITGVAMSNSITAAGAAVAPKTVFSSTDPVIYAVLSIKNATQRTELSYTRYYNGKYVDSKVSHPTKDGVQYFNFNWTLKPGQTRKAGSYTLNFYVNGKKAKTINYSIK